MSKWSDVYERLKGFPTMKSELALTSDEVYTLLEGIERRDEIIKELLSERQSEVLSGANCLLDNTLKE